MADVGKGNLAFRTHHYINVGAALLVRQMQMGDDTASLGVSVERSRLVMMLVAVVLYLAATAWRYYLTVAPPHRWHSRWGQAAVERYLLVADLAQQLHAVSAIVTASLGVLPYHLVG